MKSYHKFIFLVIGNSLIILFLVFLSDLTYKSFFERIPPIRGEVYLQTSESSIHQRSTIEKLFYELKPNSQKDRFKINSLGMRDKEPERAKDSYMVLVMGDSVTFGLEVNQNQLFTEIAEKILNTDMKKVEILNAGVCCYNTSQEYIALKNKYLNLRPDLVIFAFCINDLGEAGIQYSSDDFLQREILKSTGILEKLYYRNLSSVKYLALTLPKHSFLTIK